MSEDIISYFIIWCNYFFLTFTLEWLETKFFKNYTPSVPKWLVDSQCAIFCRMVEVPIVILAINDHFIFSRASTIHQSFWNGGSIYFIIPRIFTKVTCTRSKNEVIYCMEMVQNMIRNTKIFIPEFCDFFHPIFWGRITQNGTLL